MVLYFWSERRIDVFSYVFKEKLKLLSKTYFQEVADDRKRAEPEFNNLVYIPWTMTGSSDGSLLNAFSSIKAAHTNDLTIAINNSALSCPELISNELSGWTFCCVRRAISNPFPTALKTRDAFQVWPVHVTGYTPHRPYSFTLEIPGTLPARGRGIRSGSAAV